MNADNKISIPLEYEYHLPEKILQFGAGVLLRGLPDYFISKANRQKMFNGKIVVVKSTGKGDAAAFVKQDNLYMHTIRGFTKDGLYEEVFINAAINRVLAAKDNWNEILKCAANPGLQIIISNTTEAGIVLDKNDSINAKPPQSFPAKLLAFLYKRYKVFNGSDESGMVIIPTELITNNAGKLKAILIELAGIYNLEKTFIDWLLNANDFCNSLVDRIVTASPDNDNNIFEDALAVKSEPYALWAVETSSAKTKELLSFAQADERVIIANDITKYIELKLRLLNATHTFCCALALHYKFELVNATLQNAVFKNFMQQLMQDEIAPCIIDKNITHNEAIQFAETVISRFANPYIHHQWQTIASNYTKKIKSRCLPLLVKHYAVSTSVPQKMAIGFAAYLLYLKNNLPEDDEAKKFYSLWKINNNEDAVRKVLSDKTFWSEDLNALPGFTDAVCSYINLMSDNIALDNLIAFKWQTV